MQNENSVELIQHAQKCLARDSFPRKFSTHTFERKFGDSRAAKAEIAGGETCKKSSSHEKVENSKFRTFSFPRCSQVPGMQNPLAFLCEIGNSLDWIHFPLFCASIYLFKPFFYLSLPLLLLLFARFIGLNKFNLSAPYSLSPFHYSFPDAFSPSTIYRYMFFDWCFF